MHPHVIDWFRTSEIHLDAKLAEARWNGAKKFSEKLSRPQCISIVRTFLFANIGATVTKDLTDAFLAIDKEFPVANNAETLRVMAGLVIVIACEEHSWQADAMCLGLRAARFPGRKDNPAQLEIIAIADAYFRDEANRLRPSDFNADVQSCEKTLIAKGKALQDAVATGDAAKIQTAQSDYQKAVAGAIRDGDSKAADQIRRLAEESALLWWVFNEHSSVLDRPLSSLSVAEYALFAGFEAADRSHVIPPSPSMHALICRALRCCKGSSNKKLPLADYLGAIDEGRRLSILQKFNFADCLDLVPIITALSKCQECQDVGYAMKVLPNLCQGIASDIELLPTEAAQQFYAELLFLNALH